MLCEWGGAAVIKGAACAVVPDDCNSRRDAARSCDSATFKSLKMSAVAAGLCDSFPESVGEIYHGCWKRGNGACQKVSLYLAMGGLTAPMSNGQCSECSRSTMLGKPTAHHSETY